MEDIKIRGGLYFDSRRVPVGAEYNGEQISIGDTVPGQGISFVKWGDIFIADRCVCHNISWADLDKHGFIFGWPVRVNGLPYLCRSLKVGAEDGVPNEWDAILDDLSEADELWHWSDQLFWGQEIFNESTRALRGRYTARGWYNLKAELRAGDIGFRPVLELLPPEPLVSDALIGQGIKVYSNNCSVTGRLVSYDDYDLELAASSPLSKTHPWIRQTEDTIFVDREAIVYLCKER